MQPTRFLRLARGGGAAPPAIPADWYDPQWTYRQRLTIDSAKVSEDLSNFPVLIDDSIVAAALFTNAKSDGSDIVVTAGDGQTKLKRELSRYDAGGTLALFVKVPNVANNSDTDIFIYYGNANANETNDTDTWDADFGGVWHFEEAAGDPAPQWKDSTGNANDGTNGNIDGGMDGIAGRAVVPDESDESISVSNHATINPSDAITVEAWIHKSSWNSSVALRKTNSYLIDSVLDAVNWRFFVWGPGGLSLDMTNAGVLDDWTYIAGTYDPNLIAPQLRAFVQGQQVSSASSTAAMTADTQTLFLGGNGSSAFLGGGLDEVRVSKVARSAGWIAATYANLSSPATFASTGGEQSI